MLLLCEGRIVILKPDSCLSVSSLGSCSCLCTRQNMHLVFKSLSASCWHTTHKHTGTKPLIYQYIGIKAYLSFSQLSKTVHAIRFLCYWDVTGFELLWGGPSLAWAELSWVYHLLHGPLPSLSELHLWMLLGKGLKVSGSSYRTNLPRDIWRLWWGFHPFSDSKGRVVGRSGN